MVSRLDYPDDFFEVCQPRRRDAVGIHTDIATAFLETRCHSALWALMSTVNLVFPDATQLRAHLRPIENELNECQDYLMSEWPPRWGIVFQETRHDISLTVNDFWMDWGIRLELPWELEPSDNFLPATRELDGGLQHRHHTSAQRQPGPNAATPDKISPGKRAGAAARARWSQTQQNIDETFEHDFLLSNGGANAMHRTTQASMRPHAPTHDDLAERKRLEIQRESINPDPARFGGVVNAFKLDEDPHSRPLQGQDKIITIIDNEDMPVHEFRLVHEQKDHHTTHLVGGLRLRLQTDRESQTGLNKPFEVALNAIRTNLVEQIASSATADGDIWVTPMNNLTVARVFLDLPDDRAGRWSLFGIGVGMCEGRLYLLQSGLQSRRRSATKLLHHSR